MRRFKSSELKADFDKNGSIDFTEFGSLWSSLAGEGEVRREGDICYLIRLWTKTLRAFTVETFN